MIAARGKRWVERNRSRASATKHAWYMKNRERLIKYGNDHYYANRDKHAATRKEYDRLHPIERISRFRKYIASNPQKTMARAALSRAIRAGKLIRSKTCSKCRIECKTEAHHHHGYDADHALDVIWLCKKCHWKFHSKPRP